jgi:hypothetical protein
MLVKYEDFEKLVSENKITVRTLRSETGDLIETMTAATEGRNSIIATELQADDGAIVVTSELSVETNERDVGRETETSGGGQGQSRKRIRLD